MRRGAFDYLPKPFTPDQLRLVLDRIAGVRRLQSHVEDLEEQVRVGRPRGRPADARSRPCGRRWTWRSRSPPTRGDRPDPRRERHGQGRAGPGDPRAQPARGRRRSSRSTARACRPSCWRASCSATSGGRSPGPSATRRARSRRPRAARCSSTRSATCRWRCSPSCCGCSRRSATSASARRGRGPANVRILAATNRDLEAEVAAGRFREDLLYRLNVIEVVLPPLRQRRGRHPAAGRAPAAVLRPADGQAGRPASREAARAAMLRYPWPGNVRELRNAIERGVILAAGPRDRPGATCRRRSARQPARRDRGRRRRSRSSSWRPSTSAASSPRRRRIDEAAATLGIDPSTLYRKRKRYGLVTPIERRLACIPCVASSCSNRP